MTLDITTPSIDDQEQAQALDRLGCTMAQGYLFAPPMPAAAMTETLEAESRRLVTQP